MSFNISKNKMTFVTNEKAISKELTTKTDKIVAKSTTHLLDTVLYLPTDGIFHASFQFRAYLPNLQIANFPECFNVVINNELTEQCVINLKDYFIVGYVFISNTTPIHSIQFNVTSKPNAHFVIPANSVIHYGILPNEGLLASTIIPQPPTIPFNGLPSFLEAACIHPMFPHKVLFFKNGQVYTYNLDTTTHETTESMSEIFPEFNGSISSILRTNYKQLNAEGEVTYWDISIWSTEDIYYTYRFNVHFNGNWTHISSDSNHPDHLNGEAKDVSSGSDRMFFKNGQVENSSNNFVNYGENTGIYEEIVGTVSAAFRDLVENKYHAFAGNQHYILNHENKTVILTETYG